MPPNTTTHPKHKCVPFPAHLTGRTLREALLIIDPDLEPPFSLAQSEPVLWSCDNYEYPNHKHGNQSSPLKVSIVIFIILVHDIGTASENGTPKEVVVIGIAHFPKHLTTPRLPIRSDRGLSPCVSCRSGPRLVPCNKNGYYHYKSLPNKSWVIGPKYGAPRQEVYPITNTAHNYNLTASRDYQALPKSSINPSSIISIFTSLGYVLRLRVTNGLDLSYLSKKIIVLVCLSASFAPTALAYAHHPPTTLGSRNKVGGGGCHAHTDELGSEGASCPLTHYVYGLGLYFRSVASLESVLHLSTLLLGPPHPRGIVRKSDKSKGQSRYRQMAFIERRVNTRATKFYNISRYCPLRTEHGPPRPSSADPPTSSLNYQVLHLACASLLVLCLATLPTCYFWIPLTTLITYPLATFLASLNIVGTSVRLTLDHLEALIFRPLAPCGTTTDLPIFYRLAARRAPSDYYGTIGTDSDPDLEDRDPEGREDNISSASDPADVAVLVKRLYKLSHPSLGFGYMITSSDYGGIGAGEPDVETLLRWVGAPLKVFEYRGTTTAAPSNCLRTLGPLESRAPSQTIEALDVLGERLERETSSDSNQGEVLHKSEVVKLAAVTKGRRTLAKMGGPFSPPPAPPKCRLMTCKNSGTRHVIKRLKNPLPVKLGSGLSDEGNKKCRTNTSERSNKTPRTLPRVCNFGTVAQRAIPVIDGLTPLHLESCPSCSICLEDYETGQVLWGLPSCRHTYHRDCIYAWVARNPTCPICRSCIYVSNYSVDAPP